MYGGRSRAFSTANSRLLRLEMRLLRLVFTVANGAKHALCPCHGARGLWEDGASLDDRDYRAELLFKPDSTHGALELSIDVL